MLRAITRTPSRSLPQCALTHLERQPIDYERALRQHANYRACLAAHGVHVTNLPAQDELPDAVFVEDTAIVLADVAVITRPGHPARRAETQTIAEALAPHRALAHLSAPSTLDGGDVLRIGDVLYVGQSARTNHAGLKQLAHAVLEHGCRVKAVSVRAALHLKSACTYLGRETLLVAGACVPLERFGGGLRALSVDPDEPGAANTLRLGDTIVIPSAFPKTAAALVKAGFAVERVDVSEFQKAEAGVTCMSLLFETRD